MNWDSMWVTCGIENKNPDCLDHHRSYACPHGRAIQERLTSYRCPVIRFYDPREDQGTARYLQSAPISWHQTTVVCYLERSTSDGVEVSNVRSVSVKKLYFF